VDLLQRDYTALNPRKLSSYSPPWEPEISNIKMFIAVNICGSLGCIQLWRFWLFKLYGFVELKMEAVCFSETLVPTNMSTRPSKQEDPTSTFHWNENLKSHIDSEDSLKVSCWKILINSFILQKVGWF
jgi:hypothetical protein